MSGENAIWSPRGNWRQIQTSTVFLLCKYMGNSSPRGTKPAGVICAIALKFLSKILDGEMDFW